MKKVWTIYKGNNGFIVEEAKNQQISLEEPFWVFENLEKALDRLQNQISKKV